MERDSTTGNGCPITCYERTRVPQWTTWDTGYLVPPELGNLARLWWLDLQQNELNGPIPPELGNLAELHTLNLWGNGALSGPIPAELGNLANLVDLDLAYNELTGPIPAELGNLANLEYLRLEANELNGPIPAAFERLASLEGLILYDNSLSGLIPPELGGLVRLEALYLSSNAFTGPIPPELGRLASLEWLSLHNNVLTGSIPPEFEGMTSLRNLRLANNSGLTGPLPVGLTTLGRLEELLAGGTGLCAPADPAFRAWLDGVDRRRIATCFEGDPPAAYLTQAVQSREFPVPLVAGEMALLRVFPTASRATSQGIPAVRARFFHNGRETYVADIPGKSAQIPTEVDEGDLDRSANTEIPAQVIQPGLEMVIEIDPTGTLDASLGVATRIPESGRLEVEVKTMPLFNLTLIPFVWQESGDSSVVDLVRDMAADPDNHDMLGDIRTMLPIADLDVTAHAPVLSSSNNSDDLLGQTQAIRAMEGGTGHFMGTMPQPVTGPTGIADTPGWSSFSIPGAGIMAHELGHNLSLGHAPCGTFGDPLFPYSNGSIGAWGYDFSGDGRLLNPITKALMSYCGPKWISDYYFTQAFQFRLSDAGAADTGQSAPASRGLLLWGGVDADSVPFLEPAFVVNAPPALPRSGGEYRLAGRTSGGAELFALSFDMPETADGDGSSGFAFVLPARPGWESSLATITLSGPERSFTLDGDSDLPVVILRDTRTGQVRGILRDPQLPIQAVRDAAAYSAGPNLNVLFSRGMPGSEAWRR